MNPHPFPPQSVISTDGTTPGVPSTSVERAARSVGPAPGARPLIELHAVSKSFGSPGRTEHALRGISLSIDAGEFVGVVGKSGSGKSTLLNMITGIDRPTEGGITVDGARVDRLDEERRAVWRGRKVGIVFQFFQLLPTLSVLENVMLPMDFSGTYPSAERRRRAEALLELVGIPEQAGKLPSALSGGQQQRAAIARALANDPPLIVADEPTGNLDSVTALNVIALLGRLVEQGRTVVVVTHEREVANYVHRVVCLRDGRIEAETPGALGLARLGGARS
jgi:putative ABC transport system ATP-binding protein